jgi:hypothetical protein
MADADQKQDPWNEAIPAPWNRAVGPDMADARSPESRSGSKGERTQAGLFSDFDRRV